MLTLRVTGANALGGLADRLRYAGRTDLMRELRGAITAAGKPLDAAVRAEATAVLPRAYAATLLPALRVRTVTRTGANTAGVTIEVTARGRRRPRHVRDVDAGRLRHPRWGDRAHWYTTRVRPGFFARPAAQLREQVSADVARAITDMRRRIIGGS